MPPLQDTDEVARRIIEQRVAPQVSLGCARRDDSETENRGVWKSALGGTTSTYFDLASVTKSMTAVAVVAAGIHEHTPLGDLLPESHGTKTERATMGELLSHRAGLDGHRAIYAPLLASERVSEKEALRIAAEARRTDVPEPTGKGGFPPLYSDLGYILAGAALARVSRCVDAGEAIEKLVLAPLGLSKSAGTARGLAASGVSLAEVAAPTEDVPWRGGIVRGVVHDENAWAITGLGGGGHAGIFGTANAVIDFGRAVQDSLDGVRAPFGNVNLAWLVQERPGGTLRAGFDGKSREGSSAGVYFGRRSFGHLGFTGTSLWIDPDAKVVAVLLTNRVSPSRENTLIRDARPDAHDDLFLWAMSL